MSMEMRVEGQHLLVVRIHGLLRVPDIEESQRAAAKLIREVGKVTLLVLLDDFQGWEPGEGWGDVSFLMEHDDDIEKMAIVGQEKWREQVLVFAGVGIRRSPVRYFNDSESARAWLADNPARDTVRHPGGKSD
jgi:stage II sporulation SpoAA-like protein